MDKQKQSLTQLRTKNTKSDDLIILVRKLITERERITSDLRHISHPGPDGILDPAIKGPARKAVGAGGVIGERGADPRLQIAHVPGELRALAPAQALELLHRFAQPVDAVADLLEAVLDGGALPRLQPAELCELRHE